MISISSTNIELLRVAILSVCISCGDLGIQGIFSCNLSCPIYWHKIAHNVPLLFFLCLQVISSLPFLLSIICFPFIFWIVLMFSKNQLLISPVYFQCSLYAGKCWFLCRNLICYYHYHHFYSNTTDRVMWLFRVPVPFPWDIEQRAQTFYSGRRGGGEGR